MLAGKSSSCSFVFISVIIIFYSIKAKIMVLFKLHPLCDTYKAQLRKVLHFIIAFIHRVIRVRKNTSSDKIIVPLETLNRAVLHITSILFKQTHYWLVLGFPRRQGSNDSTGSSNAAATEAGDGSCSLQSTRIFPPPHDEHSQSKNNYTLHTSAQLRE